MFTPGLPLVLGLAGFFLALLTILPGLVLKLVALGKNLRGRRVESPPVLGPLFWDELVRVTRRGVHFRLRTAYSLFLLVSLLVAYLSEFHEVNPIRLILGSGHEVPRERITAFAETFFHVFLFCQLVALTVIAPVFAGGSITEEKDRGTLAFLQTSLLSNREIVLGKLAARVVFVLGLSLTGLPVLALTLLFGGVDPDILLTSFLAAVMSTVSLAAFSFWQATRKATLKEVLTSAYIRVVLLLMFAFCLGSWSPYFSCLSPFAFTLFSIRNWPALRFDLFDTTVAFICVHGCLALFYALLAMGNVRTILVEQRLLPPPDRLPTVNPVWVEQTSPELREVLRRERAPSRFKHVPYVDEDDPLLWKETYFGNRLPTFEMDLVKGCVTGLLVALLLPLGFMILASLAAGEPQRVLNGLFRVASIGYGALVIPLAGVRAVGCVSRERQQQTLDSLFMLPVNRADLLRAKLRAAFFWVLPWLVAFVVFSFIPLGTGSVDPAGYLTSLLLLTAAVPFFLTLAVWLSVRCVTVVRATTWYLGVVFASFLLPPMAAVLVRGAVELFGGDLFLDTAASALSLPFALDAAGFAVWPSLDRSEEKLSAAMSGAMVLCMAGVCLSLLFWRNAVRRFENEGR